MKTTPLLCLLLFPFLFLSCSETKTLPATPSQEEVIANLKLIKTEQDKAIQDFIDSSAKGWTLQGVAAGDSTECAQNERRVTFI
jgi:hypothetical protein